MSLSTGAVAPAVIGGATMGTTWSVRLVLARDADLHALHADIQGVLDAVVAQMSTWEPDSAISRFNRAGAGTWFELPGAFAEVLACALAIAEASDGAFDPTVGPAVDLWGFGAAQMPRRVPDAGLLETAASRIGWRRVRMESARALQPGGLRLDLSAIAKGYGVDLVAQRLRAAGIAGALVEVGGELYGYGRKPDGGPWRVLVEAAPDEEAHDAEPRVLALDGRAVATSGDRWHGFEHDGERYTHTFDPRSGAPVRHAAASVTVVAGDAMHADAWATALTVMGREAGLAFAERRGLAARFVSRDGSGLVESMTAPFRALLDA